MRVKQKWQMDALRRITRGTTRLIVRLPMRGPGEVVLAEVACMDGKAVIMPGTRRCGYMVCDWSVFMRYVRRHRLA